jgi:hypothetical protein
MLASAGDLFSALRKRQAAIRRELVQVAGRDGIEGGFLAMLGSVGVGLDGLEARLRQPPTTPCLNLVQAT